ncbi:cupin domain-containing protein [Sphingomonas sp. DT-51]|uniref:cupin domain-containing protein n=1 Tax=Sphingomonas sp. DT-51 TaxID=3396165 RepID=UPI003F1B590A
MAGRAKEVALLVAGVALGATGVAVAQASGDALGPAVFAWNSLVPKRTDVGEVRSVVRRPTETLRELEIHVTTLNPGFASHPPHRHPNEELIIVDQGEVETLSAGTWRRVGAGSIIFNASDALHALRNVGSAPARYHVVNWTSAATPRA